MNLVAISVDQSFVQMKFLDPLRHYLLACSVSNLSSGQIYASYLTQATTIMQQYFDSSSHASIARVSFLIWFFLIIAIVTSKFTIAKFTTSKLTVAIVAEAKAVIVAVEGPEIAGTAAGIDPGVPAVKKLRKKVAAWIDWS